MGNDISNAVEVMHDAGARAIGLLAHLIEHASIPNHHMARAVEIVKQFNDAVESTRPQPQEANNVD